jgi:putative endonuclease
MIIKSQHITGEQPTAVVFYVYVLKSKKDGFCYTGSTSDLRHRLIEHNAGLVRSTAPRRPFVLVYYEAYQSEKTRE